MWSDTGWVGLHWIGELACCQLGERTAYRLNGNKRRRRSWGKGRPLGDIAVRSSVSDHSCERHAWLGEILGFEDGGTNFGGTECSGEFVLLTLFRLFCFNRLKCSGHCARIE